MSLWISLEMNFAAAWCGDGHIKADFSHYSRTFTRGRHDIC
jgi:hypothetical protein